MEELTKEDLLQFEFVKDKFEPLKVIGEGTFSVVYKARDLSSGEAARTVAIKKITRTTSPARIAQELRFLRALDGQRNIVRLLDVAREEDQVLAVFPFVEHCDFREFSEGCSLDDVRAYVHALLVALRGVHFLGIIHRDVKPTNFLYSAHSRTGQLIDFGLAEYERPSKPFDTPKKRSVVFSRNKMLHTSPALGFFRNSIVQNAATPGYYVDDTRPPLKASRAGTRGFRAPEVLFKVPNQTTKIDLWCCGVIMLTLLTRRYPFFAAHEDTRALAELSCVYGVLEMKKAAKHYDRVWKSNLSSIPVEQVPFEKIVHALNPGFAVPLEAFDLLYMLLDLYAEKRITAECAIKHPFFHSLNQNKPPQS